MELDHFWNKVWRALQRIIALMLFACADSTLEWVLIKTVLRKASETFREVVFLPGQIIFAALYVYLLWDMLAVFIPTLRRKSPPHPEGESDGASSTYKAGA